jgi:hypothetical protein
MKRVIYSKYLMERAKVLLAKNNELSSAEALLAAHDSVEMLMHVVTDHLKIVGFRDFMEFWKVVKNAIRKEPPRKEAMGRLNHARVGFKHMGILPNPSVVSDILRNAIAFCEEISQEHPDLEYESVSLADVIQVKEARDKIIEAEKHKADGNFGQAIASLSVAFDALLDDAQARYESALVGRIEYPGRGIVLDREAKNAISKVQKLAETVDMLILGVDVGKLRRFDQLTPIRQHAYSGDVMLIWTRDHTRLTIEDFDFCHAYVIDFGLSIV